MSRLSTRQRRAQSRRRNANGEYKRRFLAKGKALADRCMAAEANFVNAWLDAAIFGASVARTRWHT